MVLGVARTSTESWSQGVLVGMILAGRLGIAMKAPTTNNDDNHNNKHNIHSNSSHNTNHDVIIVS